MNIKTIMDKLSAIESSVLKEEIDPDMLLSLAQEYKNGDLSYEEFTDKLQELEYTDSSMRQGEMGEYDNDTPAGHRSWDKEKDEWDEYDNDDYDNDKYIESSTNSGTSLTECGEMSALDTVISPPTAKQQDSVSMNINMSGSGSNGIRDLLNVLKSLDDPADQFKNDEIGDDSLDMPFVMRDRKPSADKQLVVDTDMPSLKEFENSVDGERGEPAYMDYPKNGDDLHSGHNKVGRVMSPKLEDLVQKLEKKYQAIKENIEAGNY